MMNPPQAECKGKVSEIQIDPLPFASCRSKVKSSSSSKVESSGPGKASWRDAPTEVVIDQPESKGSSEGLTRSTEEEVASEADGTRW